MALIPVDIEKALLESALDEDSVLNASDNISNIYKVSRPDVLNFCMMLRAKNLLEFYVYGKNNEIIDVSYDDFLREVETNKYNIFISQSDETIKRLSEISGIA